MSIITNFYGLKTRLKILHQNMYVNINLFNKLIYNRYSQHLPEVITTE